jgi:IclR family KDG regulon transcriptional repressor
MSVLQRATQTLDHLVAAESPVRLGEVAAAVGLPKSSAHRLLAEMVMLGIVRRELGGYTLGSRLLYWGAAAAARISLGAYAEGPMRRLRDQLGESVHLYVVDSGSRVCIAAVESRYSLRPFVSLGRHMALGVGSSGRLLLAFQPRLRRDAVLADLERAQEVNVPTPAELDRMRDAHWEVSYGEREDGVVAAATTVRSPDGRVIAVMTVSGPSTRLTEQDLVDFREPMMATSNEIARLLAADGGQPAVDGR